MRFLKKGFYVTKWNSQRVRRYGCRRCGCTFSSHTQRPHYRQHRPDLNDVVFQLYASGMTQRRMALVLGVNRKTVIRKFLFLAALTRQFHKAYVQKGLLSTHHAQFDEMESFEHTRLKPVTIAVVVNAKSGEIIDAKVASLSYKGPLAAFAFQKYGPRPNHAARAIKQSLRTLRACANPELLVTTDLHPAYPRHLRAVLPKATHHRVRSHLPDVRRDRSNPNDALFTLNYTAAKIRNDLSRMARKTWVTTKKYSRLQAHLNLYIAWNNRYQVAI